VEVWYSKSRVPTSIRAGYLDGDSRFVYKRFAITDVCGVVDKLWNIMANPRYYKWWTPKIAEDTATDIIYEFLLEMELIEEEE